MASSSVPAPQVRHVASRVDVQPLADVIASLRAPDGCPWDRVQTHVSLVPYLIEESWELADAIEDGRPADVCAELGDVLLQVVLHAQIAEEAGHFGFQDVCDGIRAKMIERHPHVFGDGSATDADDVARQWNARKAARGGGVLGALPRQMPALERAEKLTRRAATVGFDWENAQQVLAKLDEEVGELREALDGGDAAAIESELGDVLFVLANLARKLGISSEKALRGTMARFERRFGHIESTASRSGRAMQELTLEEMDALWDEAKRIERAGSRAVVDDE